MVFTMPIPTAPAPAEESLSYCLLDADGHVLDCKGADRPYYAASTIKLHVLFASLSAIDGGTLDPDRSVASSRTFTGADGGPFTLQGEHLEETHPADGELITVRDQLIRMIDRSSNEATDHVIELVGLEGVARGVADLALAATRVERKIGDQSAIDQGATNETSAQDLVATIRALVGGAALSPASTELARCALRAQRVRVIGNAVRNAVDLGSKSGWVDGYRHDVAFIGDPDGEELRHLAVMSSGMTPRAADERIVALARNVLPEFAA